MGNGVPSDPCSGSMSCVTAHLTSTSRTGEATPTSLQSHSSAVQTRLTVLILREFCRFLTLKGKRNINSTEVYNLRRDSSNGFSPVLLAKACFVCKCHRIDVGKEQ